MIPKPPDLVESLVALVREVIEHYSGVLLGDALRGVRRSIENPRHPSNFLSEIDLELHDFYHARLPELLPAFVFASEEAPPAVISRDAQCDGWPDLLVLVDPLDTSELAVRGLFGYTHLLVYSLRERQPIASLVGDMFHPVRLYCAYRDESGGHRAFLETRDRDRFPLRASGEERLDRALVTAYSMRPVERYLRLADQRRLLESMAPDANSSGRIGLAFGSVALCHVASGFSDAVVEIAKGFYLWDLLPGQYILQAAGGTVLSLSGAELPLDLRIDGLEDVSTCMDRRQRFVAAGTGRLAHAILDRLDPLTT